MGTTMAMHIEKHNRLDTVGLYMHNFRQGNLENQPQIDSSLSRNNKYFSQGDLGQDFSFLEQAHYEMQKRYTGKKNPRKDAVWDIEVTFQFGGDYEGLEPEKQSEVMETASAWMIDRLGGRQNMLGLSEHFDEPEGQPHAHLDMIPITNDGRLSAKEFINGPNAVKGLQDGLMAYMQEKYPEMDFGRANEQERGFANGQAQKDYKRLTQAKADADEAMEAAKAENKQLQQDRNDFKEAAIDELAELAPEETMDAVEFRTSLDALAQNNPTKAEELTSEPAPISEPVGREQFRWLEPFERIAERLKAAREKWRAKVERDIAIAAVMALPVKSTGGKETSDDDRRNNLDEAMGDTEPLAYLSKTLSNKMQQAYIDGQHDREKPAKVGPINATHPTARPVLHFDDEPEM